MKLIQIKMTLKSKIILSYLLVILISFGMVGFILDKSLEENTLKDIKASLINQAILVEAQIDPGRFQTSDALFLDGLIKNLSRKIKTRITLVDLSGRVLADSEERFADIPSMENHAYRPEIERALSGSIGEDIRYSSTLKIDMLYIALPLNDNKSVIGAARLALPLVTVRKVLATIRKIVLLSFLCALVLAFILGLLLSRAITGPINRIINVSRRFARGEFSQKISNYPDNEIGELARTLNKMAFEIEEKIKEVEVQNQHLKAILQSMVEGIIVVDKSARIVSVNSSIEKIFGVTKAEAEGKLFLEAIRNNDLSEIISKVLKEGSKASQELALVWPVRRELQINAAAVLERGSVNGCLAVIHDVTEIRRLETIRRDFVASASHELKTPLTSIKGFVETLIEGALEDKQNAYNFLKIIHDHTNRLDNLINDLLSLSYLESKEVELRKSQVSLRDLSAKVILGFSSQIKNKAGLKIENDLSLGLAASADPDKIEQVLTNLLDNAIKFSRDAGTIKIYDQAQEAQVKIVVEDSGLGIPVKDLPRIFERFYRVDKTRSRELGGTGLGLSIVKHIVELHEGKVGVESQEGVGSKFWFTLPK